ncbi:MAG: peptidoglycan-binding domain-containing protein [Nannocystaceae bacterium]
MPWIHRVRRGECLSLLAHRAGFRDGAQLLDLQSDELKSTRHPNVLLVGDQIRIPEPTERVVDVATDGRQRMKLRRERMVLRLLVGDPEDDETWGYALHLGHEVHTGTTDGGTALEHAIPIELNEASLETWPAEEGATAEDAQHVMTWTLLLGHLDPASELTGLQQRLHNLGLYHGEIGSGSLESLDAATATSLQRLQRELGLEPTGVYDDETRDALCSYHDED